MCETFGEMHTSIMKYFWWSRINTLHHLELNLFCFVFTFLGTSPASQSQQQFMNQTAAAAAGIPPGYNYYIPSGIMPNAAYTFPTVIPMVGILYFVYGIVLFAT